MATLSPTTGAKDTVTRHEALYQRTVENFAAGVEAEQFSDASIPRLTDDLRSELGQCLELGLITPAFYTEKMERIAAAVKVLMEK